MKQLKEVFEKEWRVNASLSSAQTPTIENSAALKHEKDFHLLPIINQKSKKQLENDTIVGMSR